MPADHSRELRQAVIEHLKAAPAVAVIVGGRVRQEVDPNDAWPFIRYGVGATAPYDATRWSGSDHDVTIHGYAKGPGRDACEILAAAIVEALDDAALPLIGVGLVGFDWNPDLGTEIVKDPAEPDGYHAICRFTAQTIAS